MGFLDDLKGKAEEFGRKAREGFEVAKDKAANLVGDLKERFDHDETSADGAQPASGYSPDAAQGASYGLHDAVTEWTAAGEATAADGTEEPAVDPLDPTVEAVDPMVEPIEPIEVTEDPLESAPEIQPAEPAADTDDPLEATPDRTS
jgi:hypothetical protein